MLLAAGAAMMHAPSAVYAQSGSAAISYDSVAQDLGAALTALGRKANREIYFSSDLTRGKRAPTVRGARDWEDALRRLLSGSGLTYRINASGAIVIEQGQSAPSSRAEEGSGDEEIIVTGTNIRGAEPTGSQVQRFTRADIDRAGSATAQDFLERLPQNFGGGQTEDNLVDITFQNPGISSGANLRGLGSSSTLVLLNGRRLPAAGFGEFTDISMLPVSAIERIEVLADGASAIYGSDAIAGVINFVLRTDYEGAETRARYGFTTRGGGREFQIGQTLGTNWGSGGIIATYEYNRRGVLDARQRRFIRDALATSNIPRYDVLPLQDRHSAYVSAHQQLLPGVELRGDALLAWRKVEQTSFDTSFPSEYGYSGNNFQYGGTLALDVALPGDFKLALGGTLGVNEIDPARTTFASFPDANATVRQRFETRILDAKVDGTLFTLPAGKVRLALGASYRRDSFEYQVVFPVTAPTPVQRLRSHAVFGELAIPLIGEGTGIPLIHRLELMLAGRYEKYSSFGETKDPKIGADLWLDPKFRLRGSWGTSFRTPTLLQTNEFGTSTNSLRNLADPSSPTGISRGIVLFGNNAALQPERAEVLTLGADYTPSNDFSLSLTWFDYRYRDRLRLLTNSPAAILADPAYAGLVMRRGAPGFDALVATLLQGLTASGNAAFVSGCVPPADPATRVCSEPASNFALIVDRRIANLATAKVRGLDLMLNYGRDLFGGRLDLSANASYLVDFKQRVTEQSPERDLVDTPRNPVDLKARGSAAWTSAGDRYGVRVALNYVDGYRDTVSIPNADVDAYATVDLQLSARLGESEKAPRLALNIANLFDARPPYFRGNDALFRLGYDPTNADALGRVISLQLVKSW